MLLILTRTEFGPDGIFGVLHTEDYDFVAHTLEHAYWHPGEGWIAKIPFGEFQCMRGTHQLAGGAPFETFEVTGVAGHSGLLFHCGNVDKDSEGCILLGTAETDAGGQHIVTASRQAFGRFMELMAGQTTFQLSIDDAPDPAQ